MPNLRLTPSNGTFCTEWDIAKALNLTLIQFISSGKFWATAIPEFYLKSKDAKVIKDFKKPLIKTVEFGTNHKPNQTYNFLTNLLNIYN